MVKIDMFANYLYEVIIVFVCKTDFYETTQTYK